MNHDGGHKEGERGEDAQEEGDDSIGSSTSRSSFS